MWVLKPRLLGYRAAIDPCTTSSPASGSPYVGSILTTLVSSSVLFQQINASFPHPSPSAQLGITSTVYYSFPGFLNLLLVICARIGSLRGPDFGALILDLLILWNWHVSSNVFIGDSLGFSV